MKREREFRAVIRLSGGVGREIQTCPQQFYKAALITIESRVAFWIERVFYPIVDNNHHQQEVVDGEGREQCRMYVHKEKPREIE